MQQLRATTRKRYIMTSFPFAEGQSSTCFASAHPIQSLRILPRHVASGLEVVGEGGQIGPKAGSEHFGGADFVVEVDDLSRGSARRRIEIQALVIAAAVVGERDPAHVPPVRFDRPLGRALGVFKGALL